MNKLLVIVAAISIAACNRKPKGPPHPPEVPVTVGKVEVRTMPVLVRAVGNIDAYATVSVGAQVAGIVNRVSFQEGQSVKAGDPLFELDPRPFQSAVAQANGLLARDRVLAKNAQADVARYAELVGKQYVTRQQYDTARAQAAAMRAAVAADEAAVQSAELNLSYTEIKAPIGGRTGVALVKAGALVKANDTTLVVIAQVQPIYADFSVPERSLPEIRERFHAGAELPVTAVPAKQGAPTASVGSAGNAGISENANRANSERKPVAGTSAEEGRLVFLDNTVNSTTGTILLKALFDNREEALWPGQFVDVTLTVRQQANTTVAPADAVQQGQSGPYVWVVADDGTADIRSVQLGATEGNWAIVQSGLKPGETVVIDGQTRLAPKARVRINTPGQKGQPSPQPSASPSNGGTR